MSCKCPAARCEEIFSSPNPWLSSCPRKTHLIIANPFCGTSQIAGELSGSTSVSLEGKFKALEGNNAVDDELAKMKGLVSCGLVLLMLSTCGRIADGVELSQGLPYFAAVEVEVLRSQEAASFAFVDGKDLSSSTSQGCCQSGRATLLPCGVSLSKQFFFFNFFHQRTEYRIHGCVSVRGWIVVGEGRSSRAGKHLAYHSEQILHMPVISIRRVSSLVASLSSRSILRLTPPLSSLEACK